MMNRDDQYLHPAQAHHKHSCGCLIAGRLSHSLGSKNTALSLIMGPPEVWQAPEGPTLAAHRAGQRHSALDSRAAAKSPGAVLHEALQQQLRSGLTKIGFLSICMQLIMLHMVPQDLDNLNWLIHHIYTSYLTSEGCTPAAGCCDSQSILKPYMKCCSDSSNALLPYLF